MVALAVRGRSIFVPRSVAADVFAASSLQPSLPLPLSPYSQLRPHFPHQHPVLTAATLATAIRNEGRAARPKARPAMMAAQARARS